MKKYRDYLDKEYEELYAELSGKAYEKGDLTQVLEGICAAIEAACEILDKLAAATQRLEEKNEKVKEVKETKKEVKKEVGNPNFKIGADIGEKITEEDIIAKIFGN